MEEEVHALEMGWQAAWLLGREGLQIAAAAENPSGTGQQNCTHTVAFVAFARDFSSSSANSRLAALTTVGRFNVM